VVTNATGAVALAVSKASGVETVYIMAVMPNGKIVSTSTTIGE
jgi:hypothetical protein